MTQHNGENFEDFLPADIRYTFHGGHLYYPFRVLVRNNGGAQVETRVLKSDRSILKVEFPPRPDGAEKGRPICQLSDGTVIDGAPGENPAASWSVASIMRYAAGTEDPRELPELLGEIDGFIRSRVWLPRAEDYWLLALAVPVTYAQSIFAAVPILHACGKPGSGKSQLGATMAAICANSCILAKGSEAAWARLIDECRGFIVMDDLEAIAAGRPGVNCSDLVQALKVSYTKDTAIKTVTNTRDMRTQTLHLFGVKLINNTRGTDPILGARMLRILTHEMPKGFARPAYSGPGPGEIRDALHTWAFSHVNDIVGAYDAVADPGNRATQIAAPLRVIAKLAGGPWPERLQRALIRQAESPADFAGPASLVRAAAANMLARGFKKIAVCGLAMEARAVALEHGLPADMQTQLNEAWTGRLAREMGLLDPLAPEIRKRFCHVQTRILTLRTNGSNGSEPPKSPFAFCTRACNDCRYTKAACPIQAALRRQSKR